MPGVKIDGVPDSFRKGLRAEVASTESIGRRSHENGAGNEMEIALANVTLSCIGESKKRSVQGENTQPVHRSLFGLPATLPGAAQNREGLFCVPDVDNCM